ncbi:TPA: glycosyltransferase family 2 protein [Photobacterium damselae]
MLNIITVNYETSEETIGMIKSIKNSVGDFFEKCNIVIVDNNSSSLEIDKLNNIEESNDLFDVKVIKLNDNIGYFPALNVGLNSVDNKYGENITIICNNDLIYDVSFFEKLSKCKFSDEVYAIAPSVKTINSIYQNPSMANKPSKARMFMYELYYSNYIVGKILLNTWRSMGLGIDSSTRKDLKERYIFIGIGAIYILTSNFFKNNDKLDYDLFLYGEEAFFSQQVHHSNGQILYKPSLEVLHLESISTKKIPSKKNYLLNKLAFKNYKKYFWNNTFGE